MSTETGQGHESHEYPGGLMENPGPGIPLFLKLTYIGFTLFGILYFILYMSGDGSPLVEQYNSVTQGK